MGSPHILLPVETMELGGTTVSYVVRRSARAKYMRITISPHYGLVVTLPARLNRYINPEKLIRDKQEWVLHHLATIAPPPPPSPLVDGSTINFRGELHRIRVETGGHHPAVRLVDGEIQVQLPGGSNHELKEVVKEWVREQALLAITRETALAAATIGVQYQRLTIRDQKTKWGSCSKQGNISMNWRLILFPPQVLRYIVIHELCHLKHFNHSQRFWNLVERYDATYRDSIAWLKKFGARMEGDLR